MGADSLNLSVTEFSAKAVCSQGFTPSPRHVSSPREPPPRPSPASGRGAREASGRHARRLLHDREADAGLVAMLLRDLAPALFRFLTALERAFDLGRAFHELVEVHRTELAADHPEIAALCHHSLLPYSAA